MKRFLPLILAVAILILPFGGLRAFAYNSGYLQGLPYLVNGSGSTDILAPDTVTHDSSATDNNLNTNQRLLYGTSANRMVITLPTEKTVNSYFLSLTTSTFSNLHLIFYNSNKTVLLDILNPGLGTTKPMSILTGVKYIAVVDNQSNTSAYVKEIDVYDDGTRGLLAGKTMTTGSDINNVYGSTNKITDGSSSTTFVLGSTSAAPYNAYKTVYYKFDTTATIQHYKYTANANYAHLIFYDSNKSQIGSINSLAINGVKTSLPSTYSNVKYVALQNFDSGNFTITDLELYGTLAAPKVVTHDEISNLISTVNNTTASLSFNVPAGNADFTGAKIYRDGTFIKTLPYTATSFTDSNLELGKTYSYKVTATYSDNYETTGLTTSATTPTPPKPPNEITNLSINPKWNNVDLSWNLPTDKTNLDIVNIYREGKKIGSVSGSATSFNDSNVSPLTNYSYTVKTYSNSLALESKGVSISTSTPQEPPPKMEGTAFKELPNGDLQVTWEKPTTGTIKIIIAGKEYPSVNASDLKYLVIKSNVRKNMFGDYDIYLVPVSPTGIQGEPLLAPKVNAQLPISVEDLLGTGNNLLWLIAPLVLLSLAFLFVPKLRKLATDSFQSNKGKESSFRRFRNVEAKEQNEKEQREKREAREREPHQGKDYLERMERIKSREAAAEQKIKETKERQPERAPRMRAEKRSNSPRELRQPRTRREPTERTRQPRAQRVKRRVSD